MTEQSTPTPHNGIAVKGCDCGGCFGEPGGAQPVWSTPTHAEELEKILALVVYDRGDDVREWPLDEATLYRKEKAWSFEHGREKVRELILSKAANVVITAGWKSPAEVAELVRAGAEAAWLEGLFDSGPSDGNPYYKPTPDRANSAAGNERNT